MTISDRIDVIMSVYNCEDTLREAIDSILNQTYSNIRMIICNDASTDNTQMILDEYLKEYPEKIICLKNDETKRLAYSLNYCLQFADAEYIGRMDGDDISEKTRFEKQIAFLKQHPEYSVVGTGMGMFTDRPDVFWEKHPVIDPDRYTLKNCVPFNHATILAKAEMYRVLGGYTVSERTKTGQDYDLWFRFYSKGFAGQNIDLPLYFCRETLGTFRRRSFKYRWNEYKTTLYGFKLLKYPFKWYLKPTLGLLKGLVPAKILYYRSKQKNKTLRTLKNHG